MTYLLEFKGSSVAEVVDSRLEARGTPVDEAQAWAAAAADPLWRADRDEFMAVAAESDRDFLSTVDLD